MAKTISINLADHLNVELAKRILAKELTMATDVGKGTYREVDNARTHLERARGIYIALSTLELVPVEYAEMVGEDLTRIEDKIAATQREKEAEAYARHMQRGRS